MPDKYIYRREDNGVLVEVDFETAMGQQGGYITLSDGVMARRCVYLEQDGKPVQNKPTTTGITPEVVSDTLGVPQHQVHEFREDARRNGYSVEFTQDPDVPQFYQARFPSENEKWRYAGHRGLNDRNSRNGGGAPLSPAQFERAKQRLLEASEERR